MAHSSFLPAVGYGFSCPNSSPAPARKWYDARPFVHPNLQVKLVDAGFIWTEPHSRRLKVKLTIQAEVLNGAILQQTFVVEYVVETHMCPDCTKTAANPNTWTACVQVGATGTSRVLCWSACAYRAPSCSTGHIDYHGGTASWRRQQGPWTVPCPSGRI